MNRRVYICTARLGVMILSALGLVVNSAAQTANNPATWPAAGRDLSNSRNQLVENLALRRNPTTYPKGQLSQRGGLWLA